MFRPSLMNFFNDDFASPSMMFLNHGSLFENDSIIQDLYKERNSFLEDINRKINERKETIMKEYETNNPATYQRKFSSSKVYNNGDERSEVKDVIEENKDGQKSISQKADTYEKKDGEVIKDSHIDVQLKQDKTNKNLWTVTHKGQNVVLDASQADFGEKLQALLNTNDSEENVSQLKSSLSTQTKKKRSTILNKTQGVKKKKKKNKKGKVVKKTSKNNDK